MSLSLFRARLQRMALNSKSPAAAIKKAKFDAVAERIYRGLFGHGGEASEEAVTALAESTISQHLSALRAEFPINFGMPEGTAEARLEVANANPKQAERIAASSPTMELTPAKAKWLATQRPEIKLAIAAGQMKFPKWVVEMEENK